MRRIVESGDGNFSHAAENVLLKRWREGVDIEPLAALLQSEKSRDRSRGAYYLGEIGGLLRL